VAGPIESAESFRATRPGGSLPVYEGMPRRAWRTTRLPSIDCATITATTRCWSDIMSVESVQRTSRWYRRYRTASTPKWRDDDVLVMGEDVGKNGGVFRGRPRDFTTSSARIA